MKYKSKKYRGDIDMIYNRIIGKKALILMAQSKDEMATQIFCYKQIREIRLNAKNFEVKVLLSGDDAFHRVMKIELENSKLTKEEALKIVTGFYNDLFNAAARFTPEEVEHLKKQKAAEDAKNKNIKNKK